jgi:hypothetical protein
MYAALLWAISAVLTPRGSMSTIADVTPQAGPAWAIAAVLSVMAAILGLAAMLGIYRHFADTAQEAWARVFLACGLIGMTTLVVLSALSGVAEPFLIGLAGSTATPASFDPGQGALVSAIGALYVVGFSLNWLALVPLALAMLPDRSWPRSIAWGTLACGIVELVGSFVLLRHHTLPRLLALLGFAFLVLLGATIVRLAGPAEAAAPQPQVGVNA